MRLRELLACVPRRLPPFYSYTHTQRSQPFFFLRVWNEAFVESFRPMEKNARGPSRRTRWTAENKRADEGKKKKNKERNMGLVKKEEEKELQSDIGCIQVCLFFSSISHL